MAATSACLHSSELSTKHTPSFSNHVATSHFATARTVSHDEELSCVSVWHGCFRVSPSNCVCCSRRRGKSSCPSSSSPRPGARGAAPSASVIGRSRIGRFPTLFDRRSAIVTLPSSSRTPSSLPLDPLDFPVERAPSDLDPDLDLAPDLAPVPRARPTPRFPRAACACRPRARAPRSLAEELFDNPSSELCVCGLPCLVARLVVGIARALARDGVRATGAMRCDAMRARFDAPRSIHDERRRTTTRRKNLSLLSALSPSRARRASSRARAHECRPPSARPSTPRGFLQLFRLDFLGTRRRVVTRRRIPHGPRPRGRLVSGTWRPGGVRVES